MKLVTLFFLMFFSLITLAQNKFDANGEKHGKWLEFYPNSGVKKYYGEFNHGKPIGQFVRYDEYGGKTMIVTYDGKNYKTKAYYFYPGSDVIKAAGNYVNQKKDSIWLYQNYDEKIVGKETYRYGLLHGLTEKYFYPKVSPNGQTSKRIIIYSMPYKDSLKHGAYFVKYTSGKMKQKGVFENGQKIGKHVYYYLNGKVKREESWKYAVKHGYWVYASEDGQRKVEMYWKGKFMKGEAKDRIKAKLKAGTLKW